MYNKDNSPSLQFCWIFLGVNQISPSILRGGTEVVKMNDFSLPYDLEHPPSNGKPMVGEPCT